MKVAGILFDKDGTLMDFDSFWVSVSVVAVKEALKRLRQEESLADEILEAFGVHNGVTDPDGVLCKGTYGEMAEIFCGILEEKGSYVSLVEAEENLTEAYRSSAACGRVEGSCEHLRELLMGFKRQKIRIALVTTDRRSTTLFCLEKLGIEDLFDKIYTDDGAFPPKPSPDSALDFCRTFQLEKDGVWMVGDTLTDVNFARNAGIGMVGVAGKELSRRILQKEIESVLPDVSFLPQWFEALPNAEK